MGAARDPRRPPAPSRTAVSLGALVALAAVLTLTAAGEVAIPDGFPGPGRQRGGPLADDRSTVLTTHAEVGTTGTWGLLWSAQPTDGVIVLESVTPSGPVSGLTILGIHASDPRGVTVGSADGYPPGGIELLDIDGMAMAPAGELPPLIQVIVGYRLDGDAPGRIPGFRVRYRVGDVRFQTVMGDALVVRPADPTAAGSASLRPALAILVASSAPDDDLYPWQSCNGVLVRPAIVLTAAHCVEAAGADLDVVLGVRDLCAREGGVRRRVVGVRLPPGRDPSTGHADIAALELATPVTAEPVGIADRARGVPQARAIVPTWSGATGPAAGCELQLATVEIVPVAGCRQALDAFHREIDPLTTVCAVPTTGAPDVCPGDSGGPLVVMGARGEALVLGVVSWGGPCGRRAPGVYTIADLADPG